MRTLEAAILKELRLVANDSTIRQKDIMQWQCETTADKTSNLDKEASLDEDRYWLPELHVAVAVLKKEARKK
jgi:hypothetical protein